MVHEVRAKCMPDFRNALATGFLCSIIMDATFIQSSGMLEAQVKEGIGWKKEWGRVEWGALWFS